MTNPLSRRRFLTGLGAGGSVMALSGFTGPTYNASFQDTVLSAGEWLSYRTQRWIGGDALAPEFTEADLSPIFRTNGNSQPQSAFYRSLAASDFANFRLRIDGLVERPGEFSLEQLRAMPSRTQITRHDCVEGWSAIGKWTGVPVAHILQEVRPAANARYLVLHCADTFGDQTYYESIDLVDAMHPQTILAYGMNNGPLPVGHGAPLRLRVERQLGYKQAKYIMRIEAVAAFSGFRGGRGGYWEDTVGYDWYAGI